MCNTCAFVEPLTSFSNLITFNQSKNEKLTLSKDFKELQIRLKSKWHIDM